MDNDFAVYHAAVYQACARSLWHKRKYDFAQVRTHLMPFLLRVFLECKGEHANTNVQY